MDGKKAMTKPRKIRVYYNSACPVCNAGISYQRARTHYTRIKWLDLHSTPGLSNDLGEELEHARKYLHSVDSDGNTQVGIAAFILLWRQVPSQRWLARLFSLPGIHSIARVCYWVFANVLYHWNRRLGRW